MATPEIHFEPGDHSVPPHLEYASDFRAISDIYEGFLAGDRDAHGWNGAVTRRLQSYNPKLLIIDGQDSGMGWDGKIPGSHFDSAIDKTWVWIGLPGRPSEICGEDTIRVVAGDHAGYLNTPTWFEGRHDALMYGGSGMIGVAAYHAWKRTRLQGGNSTPERAGLSRRHLLRCSLWSLGGAAVGGPSFLTSIARKQAAYATDEGQSNAKEQWVNRWDVFSEPDSIANGRTALLIAKAEAAAQRYGYDDAAVVMGYGHTSHAQTFIDNPDRRDQFIAQATKDLFRRALDRDSNRPLAERVERIRLLQKRVVVLDVREPRQRQFERDPEAEVAKCVKLVDVFDAPRVESIVNGQ